MAQAHGDRLSAVDASFLAQERANSHMHVGAVLIFEGPAPRYEAFLDHIRSRLHLVPRYRHKLAVPPLETGRPIWVDDRNFNLEYHVRHTALPHPGSEEQLRALAARIHSQRLDRAKPLWETWLVQGLERGRFALISKTHHALVDGIAGVDLMSVLFDVSPIPLPAPHEGEPWMAAREPGALQLAARGLRGLARLPFELAGDALAAATHPAESLDAVKDALEGVGEVAWAALNPAPETPLNVPIGPHRRLSFVRNDLNDFKLVKNALGGTVNDVVLTVVAGGLRTWLRARGVRTEGLELRALVPVSVRSKDERHQLGNRLVVMRGPLPVYVEDPIARLRVVRQAMDGLKESKQAVGAEVITGLEALAPPTILAQASRLQFSTRLFNLLVTNVPGPQVPLYVLGRELEDLFPVAFLPENQALAVAIMSYNGRMDFGLLGDYDAVPDIEALAAALKDALEELVVAAAPRKKRRPRAPAATR
ncbi:MAG TPA: wax ester/triacylglycerol synthase family O-acyltransferase [Solirubrobacter sp.]|nr:wax ester/triacylglycerol synthase family O-acyltransferase [Solirubrobacter sp.]